MVMMTIIFRFKPVKKTYEFQYSILLEKKINFIKACFAKNIDCFESIRVYTLSSKRSHCHETWRRSPTLMLHNNDGGIMTGCFTIVDTNHALDSKTATHSLPPTPFYAFRTNAS